MGFTEAISSAFRQYVNFSGRARRSEFWYFYLFNVIMSVIINILTFVVPAFAIVGGIYSLAVMLPSLALAWRRMHDIGRSGAWNLISLVPLVGWILVLVWYCKDSEYAENKYGPALIR